MPELIFINNKYTDAKRAAIPVTGSGFLFGDGLFETMRSYKGNILALDMHYDRLYSSMLAMRYSLLFFTLDNIRAAILKLLIKNNLLDVDAYIKIVVARSSYIDKLIFDPYSKPDLIIFAKRLKGYPKEYYKNGINLHTSSVKRNAVGNDIYRHKLINYFENIFAKNEAVSNQAQEALFTTRDKVILEGSTSNIFTIKNGKVFTPPLTQNILPGVTRQLVIDICNKNKLKFSEKKLHYYNLMEADEVFLTNSIMEIMPVKKIDGYQIGQVKGMWPITSELHRAYRLLV